MHPLNAGQRNSEQGFTLVEVLVAMVVLSISLLGVANLQLTGLRLAQDGIHRTQAAMLAFDMSQRILANRLANQTGNNLYAGNSATSYAVDCSAADCTDAEMADYDTVVWQQMIQARIPTGNSGLVAGTGSYTTTVFWWDRNGEVLLDESVSGVTVEVYP